MPEEKLNVTGRRYKKRLIRYNDYKATLLGLAKSMGFELQATGTAVYFFLPLAVRHSKKKKAAMHYQLHQQKPDLSNLLKAFEDSLLPKRDQVVAHYSGLGKFWVDSPNGWIEVHINQPVYNPNPFDAAPKNHGILDEASQWKTYHDIEVTAPRQKAFINTIDEHGTLIGVEEIGVGSGPISVEEFNSMYKHLARNNRRSR